MRKGLNIKAWLIFFSWTIFFIHGIIPHAHAEIDARGKSNHGFSCHLGNDGEPVRIACHCEEKGNCNISGLVFQNTLNDEHFIGIINQYNFSIVTPDFRILSPEDRIILPLSLSGNISLRAPPAA